MSTAVSPPSVCQLKNAYRRVNAPNRPETAKIASAHPGDSLITIMYPMTATIRIPIPQSKKGWSAGRNRKQSTETGTAMIMAQALPSAAIRTASSPFPSRQRACAGSTEREVSASGMPRKVAGMLSTNVCVIRAANRVPARASGPSTSRRTTCAPSRTPASVLT